jgi:hypothetical protein
MLKRDPVCNHSRAAVKRPLLRSVELTEFETQRLLHAFTQGKEQVDEADCMTLLKWAMAQRLGAAMVEWMIQGDIRPVVIGDDVMVEAMPAE